MLSVRLAPEMMERLQTLADKTGRTKNFGSCQILVQIATCGNLSRL